MFNFDRLRALAKKQGMTITHLCNIVGKKNSYIADSQNNISNYLNGLNLGCTATGYSGFVAHGVAIA